ncbi:sulfotransferase [Thermodesulfobacteriota bacterium]
MEIPIIIIVGAPRSGTTMFGRVLDRHPNLSTRMQRYYIWDQFFKSISEYDC